MPEDKQFEILRAGDMQKKYGLYAENRPIITLDPMNVPEAFRHLIPFAEKWVIGDDIMREDFCDKSSQEERDALKKAIEGFSSQIYSWLGGPEAAGPTYTKEYSSFSAMMMEHDYIT